MHTRTLGPFTVSAIGFGGMPLSMNNDKAVPSESEAIATVHAALDAGITFIDTADIYAPAWNEMGHNEALIARAVASWGGNSDDILIATKGGITRGEGETWGRDGSLPYLRSAVENSLRNLNTDSIGLYHYHRPDRWLVYGDVMQSLATLKSEGKIQSIGISNASIEEIEIAIEVLGEGNLVSVQNQFSPRYPGSYEELEFCAAHQIAFLPWSPLGGTGGAARSVGDRFGIFAEIGARHGVSPQQVVLAWELSLSDVVIPIPGARRAASIVDSAQAPHLTLSPAELDACSAAVSIDRGN